MSTLKCYKCGAPLRDPQPDNCPKCGEPIELGKRFGQTGDALEKFVPVAWAIERHIRELKRFDRENGSTDPLLREVLESMLCQPRLWDCRALNVPAFLRHPKDVLDAIGTLAELVEIHLRDDYVIPTVIGRLLDKVANARISERQKKIMWDAVMQPAKIDVMIVAHSDSKKEQQAAAEWVGCTRDELINDLIWLAKEGYISLRYGIQVLLDDTPTKDRNY